MAAGADLAVSSHREALCPRCGYDQQGQVTSWREQCPIQGMCAECGLGFRWAELLHPDHAQPRWCIEFAEGRANTAVSVAKTAARSALPRRFWTHLRMAHTLVPRRLTVYALLMLASTLVPLYLGVQVTLALTVFAEQKQSTAAYAASLTRQLPPPRWVVPFDRAPLPSMRLAILADWQDNQRGWDRVVAQATVSPPALHMSASRAVVEAVFLPLSSTSAGWSDHMSPSPDNKGVIVTANPYFAPNRLHKLVQDRYAGEKARSRLMDAYALASFIAASLAMAAFMPLACALMPTSLRQARVRWPHLARIAAYSMAIPFAQTFILSILQFVVFSDHVIASPMAQLIALAWMPLLTPLFFGIWWHAAIKHYLRIPQAWLIAVLLTLLCTLLLGAIGYYGVLPIFRS